MKADALPERSLRKHTTVNQKLVRITYQDLIFEEPLRFDVPGEDSRLIEAKSVEKVLLIHKARLLGYMKRLDVPIGLFIDFYEVVLKNGIARLFLPGANLP